MLAAVVIFIIACLLMILSVLFLPRLKLGRVTLDTYWMVTLTGALAMLIFGLIDAKEVGSALIADTAVNPIKILVLFICMTILSVFLDELGFFRFLANSALRHSGGGQIRLFFILYVTVSILTIFTSNDVVILSFTPFICYFSKNAGISPFPYLAAEFVAANTWSMMLVIGNPTNVYLATSAGIDFVEYFSVMAFPTLIGGVVAFAALFLIFRHKLSARIVAHTEGGAIKDRLLLWVGIIHLTLCTVLLAVGSYLNIEMWLVSLIAVLSLTLCVGVISLVRRKKPRELIIVMKRAPWQLIPFMLSMFVMIFSLSSYGVTDIISTAFGESLPIFTYGTSSFLFANIVNNIPMSVLFASVIPEGAAITKAAVYATIIGSNLGAIFTPIGALAGIMWCSILSKHRLKFGYLDFLKIGVEIALPTLFATLIGLYIVI